MNVKNLYLTKNEPIWFEVAQGAAGVQFGIRVQDYTIPAGAVVNIYVSKPDGTLVYNAAEVSGNTITVTTTTQMTAVVGVSNCQVQILSTGILLRTFVFHLKVRESIIDETAIESTDEFGALETALQTISDYDADILALQGDISDLQGDISAITSQIGGIRYASISLGYQEGESVLSKVQRAYASPLMPKGVPFIAVVTAGAYHDMRGFWYENGTAGMCTVNYFNGLYEVTMMNGTWTISDNLRLTTETASFTSTHTIDTTLSALIRNGKTVTVVLVITTTSAISAFGTLASIPSGYRPNMQVWGRAAGSNEIRYDVTKGGAVRPCENVASGTQLYISITYVSE